MNNGSKTKKVKFTNRTRDSKGKFAWQHGGRKLVLGFLTALLLALALWRLDIYVSDCQDKTIYSPLPNEPDTSGITARVVPNYTLAWDEVVYQIVDAFKDVHPNPVLAKKYTLQALQIADCESRLNEKAYNDKNTNGSTDSGIFQINSIHGIPEYRLLQARENIEIAKKMFIKNGYKWNAWVCSRVLGYAQ
jgi:hypothetical protein